MANNKYGAQMIEDSISLPDSTSLSATRDVARNNDLDDGNLPLLQCVKKFPKIVLYALGLSIGILLYGYDFVIVGTITAMPYFQSDYGTPHFISYIIPATWLAVWSAATPLGIVAGAGFAGWLQDRFGRRPSLLVATLISTIGVSSSFASSYPENIGTRRILFLIGKLIIGIALGGLICTTQTYLSEIVPPSLRGPLITLLPIFTLLGQLIGSGVIFTQLKVTGSKSYLICLASQWPFSAALVLMVIIAPESPVWLVRKNRIDDALKSQYRLHRRGVDVLATVQTIQASIEQERIDLHRGDSDASFSDCFKGSSLRRTLIVIFSSATTNFWGLPLLASASYFLQILGQSASNSILFLIIGIVVGLVANIFSAWGVSYFQRRPLMVITFGAAAVCWVSVGISGCFKGREAVVWFTTAMLMVITVICGAGVWPVSSIVAAETSSLRLRGKTVGISWITGGLSAGVFSIAIPYLYNPDAADLGGKTGFFFGGLSLIGTAVTWLIVPEMKGRTVSEIDEMFEQRLPARQFGGWTRSNEPPILEKATC